MNIHEETLEIARSLIHKDPSLKDWVVSKFPELKEVEDEMIRKEIIQSIQDNMCVIHKDKCIAWLEKQSKEASWESFKAEDDVRRRSTIQVLEYAKSLDAYNQYGKEDIDKNIAWVKKQ